MANPTPLMLWTCVLGAGGAEQLEGLIAELEGVDDGSSTNEFSSDEDISVRSVEAISDAVTSGYHGEPGAPGDTGSRHRSAPVRILFLGGHPSDQARLALTREVERLRERFYAVKHGDAFRIEQHWEVEASKLQGLILRHEPQIVHFAGHGTPAGLVFQDVSGIGTPIPSRLLAKVFENLHKFVRCVVLNACYSRPQAFAISRSVEVVIGMNDAILDTEAIAFAGEFYQAIGYGQDVKSAFDLACTAIHFERSTRQGARRDFGMDGDLAPQSDSGPEIPELLVRTGVDPSRVRFVYD